MKIRNAILKALIFLLAFLPFGILYLFSDLLAFLAKNVIRYRYEIIHANLNRCFPDKSQKEIRKIMQRFYHNLADLVVETIKSSRMSRSQLDKRVVFNNQEVFDHLYAEQKNVYVLLGHCGNWEWVGNKIATFLKHDGAAIYKPIHDKFANDYMIKLRQKYKGTLMIEYKKVIRTLVSLNDKLIAVFVLADQSPPRTEMNYFVDFMGRKTAFYDGTEKVARMLNYSVIYLDVQRVGRGFFEVEVITITKNAKETSPDFITKKYVELLEASIKRQPDNWLWSHNRWKKREEKLN